MLLIESQCCPPAIVFRLIALYNGIIIEKHENYQKRSLRNRFYLNSPQGKTSFSIPLAKGKNQQQPISEVKISYDQNWISQLKRMLQTNYGSAPYFEFYFDGIMSIFSHEYAFLFELNQALMVWFLRQFGLKFQINYTSQYLSHVSEDLHDFRGLITSNFDSPALYDMKYSQLFEEKEGFIKGLSAIDLLFCCGPESYSIIKN